MRQTDLCLSKEGAEVILPEVYKKDLGSCHRAIVPLFAYPAVCFEEQKKHRSYICMYVCVVVYLCICVSLCLTFSCTLLIFGQLFRLPVQRADTQHRTSILEQTFTSDSEIPTSAGSSPRIQYLLDLFDSGVRLRSIWNSLSSYSIGPPQPPRTSSA